MTCICGHHEHAHAQDVGLCGSPHGCDCNQFRKLAPNPEPFVDAAKAKQDAEWLAGSEADTAERNLARAHLSAIAALDTAERERQNLHARLAAQSGYAEDETIAELRERSATTQRQLDAARQREGEWATLYRETQARLAEVQQESTAARVSAQADKTRLDWFDRIWKDDDINALDLAWQSSTPGPAGSGRAAIDAAIAATTQGERNG